MKTTYKEIHFGAIATFYVIAISLRLITLVIGKSYPTIRETYAFQLATGLGPAIGALVAMAVFKRKTEYTITGKSVLCLLAFAYGLLEEYGWRGFLQYELRRLPVWQYVLIITGMWFLWHLDFGQRNILPFLVLLLFAAWGIGKIATDTHSLLLCSAFHGIVNFSKRGLLSDTTYLVAFICIIIFWIVIWYFVKLPKKKNVSKGRQGAAY